MNKGQGFGLVAMLLSFASTSMPLLAAEQVAILDSDISHSFVSTITTSRVNGFLSIANGRNCLATDEQGTPSLISCPVGKKDKTVTNVFTMIEVAQGFCLAEGGKGPVLKNCDSNDLAQQWDALSTRSTEIKNRESNRCLTAAGINKPVTLAVCFGGPSQAWTLPQ